MIFISDIWRVWGHRGGDGCQPTSNHCVPTVNLVKKRCNALWFHQVREAIASGIFELNPADILSKHWGYAQVWQLLKAFRFFIPAISANTSKAGPMKKWQRRAFNQWQRRNLLRQTASKLPWLTFKYYNQIECYWSTGDFYGCKMLLQKRLCRAHDFKTFGWTIEHTPQWVQTATTGSGNGPFLGAFILNWHNEKPICSQEFVNQYSSVHKILLCPCLVLPLPVHWMTYYPVIMCCSSITESC